MLIIGHGCLILISLVCESECGLDFIFTRSNKLKTKKLTNRLVCSVAAQLKTELTLCGKLCGRSLSRVTVPMPDSFSVVPQVRNPGRLARGPGLCAGR